MSTQKETEPLTADEIFVIKNQDGLHKESIAMAKPKIEVKLSTLGEMSEKKMRRLQEFQYLFDKGFLVGEVKAIAESAYRKTLLLLEDENPYTRIDYVISNIGRRGENEPALLVESFGNIYNQTLYKTHTVEQAATMVDCIDYSVVELNGRHIASFVYSCEGQFKVKTFPNLKRTLLDEPKDTYMYGSITQSKLTASSWEDAVKELIERGVRYPIALTEFRRGDPFNKHYCRNVLEEILEDLDEEYSNPNGDKTSPTPKMMEAVKHFVDVLKSEYRTYWWEPTGVKRTYVNERECWESGPSIKGNIFYKDGIAIENNNNNVKE